MHISEFERTISIKDVNTLIDDTVNVFQKNYGVTLRDYKIKPECIVAEGPEGEISSGFGKGDHAIIGAYGECIEHFHLLKTGQDWDKYSTNVSKNSLYKDDIFVRFGSSLMPRSEKISALCYKEFSTNQTHFLPFSLVNGDFPRERSSVSEAVHFYSRYASSSGTAFGFCHNDALLHSALEIIERDEISKLFLNILGTHGDNNGYHKIRLESYDPSPETSSAYNKLSALEYIKDVTLLVRKTDFDAFFSFAMLESSCDEDYPVWGAGASLSLDLAIYRSLTECEQMSFVKDHAKDNRIYELAKKYPAFGRVSKMDISSLKILPAPLKSNKIIYNNVQEQLSALHGSIKRSGREILYYDHDVAGANYSVVSSYIPDTEKFFGIMFALPLLPISHLRKYSNL